MDNSTNVNVVPETQTFSTTLEVGITSSEAVTIYYTTDESLPSPNNGAMYNGPFTITESTIVKAIAIDEYGNEATDDETYTLANVNEAPVADDDTYSTNEDVTLSITASGVLGNDSDMDEDDLEAILSISPSNGTLILNSDGSFVYTPNLDYNGSDSFAYVANDGQADSNVSTVTIDVIPVNDPPIISKIDDQTVIYDEMIIITPTTKDIDGLIITFSLSPAVPSFAFFDSETGELIWTPTKDQLGDHILTLNASDGDLGYDEEFTITVLKTEAKKPKKPK